MRRLGLIAGMGEFPILFARAAKAKGAKVFAVAIKGQTSKRLSSYVERVHWIHPGQLKRLFNIFKNGRIKEIVMAGQIRPTLLFEDISMDEEFKGLLKELKDKKANTVFQAVAKRIEEMGMDLIDSTSYLEDLLVPKGPLTRRSPSGKEWQDIQFGKRIAKRIASLDIGQTVVVKDKAILAVEALEGTDEAIRRGGRLARGEVVVIKLSKGQRQDRRFDIPVIGPQTIKTLIEAKATCLAIESNETLIIHKGNCIKEADRYGISIVGI